MLGDKGWRGMNDGDESAKNYFSSHDAAVKRARKQSAGCAPMEAVPPTYWQAVHASVARILRAYTQNAT